jgi:hypothetical protein
MATKPIVPTGEIARQSNAAENVRLAAERMLVVLNEINSISEVLSDPYKTVIHLTKAQFHANETLRLLEATGIPKLRQDSLFK